VTVAEALRVPQQERAHRTRARILAGAKDAFAALGYAKTTAREIAKRAGVSTGSVYQYFSDKDHVLREIALGRSESNAKRVIGDLARPAETTDPKSEARSRMRGVALAVIDYHRADPGLHAVITERREHDPELDEHITAFERALVSRTAELLRLWKHPGDAEATAFVLFGMVEGSIHMHCLGHAMVSDARFLDALVDSLVRLAIPGLGSA